MNEDNLRSQLEARLRSVEEAFAREMLARGFEPGQAENIALPTSLARLYEEREALRGELEENMSESPEREGVRHE